MSILFQTWRSDRWSEIRLEWRQVTQRGDGQRWGEGIGEGWGGGILFISNSLKLLQKLKVNFRHGTAYIIVCDCVCVCLCVCLYVFSRLPPPRHWMWRLWDSDTGRLSVWPRSPHLVWATKAAMWPLQSLAVLHPDINAATRGWGGWGEVFGCKGRGRVNGA